MRYVEKRDFRGKLRKRERVREKVCARLNFDGDFDGLESRRAAAVAAAAAIADGTGSKQCKSNYQQI